MRQFHFDFYCFLDFWLFASDFFLNGFPNPFIAVLGLVFCLVNENSLNCTSGLVLLCFFFISSSRFLLRPYDVTTISNLLFVHSFIQFQLKCVCDVFFALSGASFFVHSRGWTFGHTLTYLTLKNDFLTLKLTFIRFNSKSQLCLLNWLGTRDAGITLLNNYKNRIN